MDMRTGELYATREAALEAGVPEGKIEHVEGLKEPVLVRITTGPFNGRIYERGRFGGLRRRKDLEWRA